LGRPLSTIPFYISDIWQGLIKGHGLITLQQGVLRLEIQLVDSLSGLIKIKHLVREAPLSDVAAVSMRSYLYGLYNVLSVQGTRMDVFDGFPRVRSGRCRLRIARRDREACSAFIERFAAAKAAGTPAAA
jgi:hypothetical protein